MADTTEYQGITVLSSPVGDGASLLNNALKDLADLKENIANKNQPSGYAGLDGNGDLIGPIILGTDTTANINALTLEEGEVYVSTDEPGLLKIGDGVNAGGWTPRHNYKFINNDPGAPTVYNCLGDGHIEIRASGTDVDDWYIGPPPAPGYRTTIATYVYNGQYAGFFLSPTSSAGTVSSNTPIFIKTDGTRDTISEIVVDGGGAGLGGSGIKRTTFDLLSVADPDTNGQYIWRILSISGSSGVYYSA